MQGKKNIGKWIGAVKCVTPKDPYCVVYEWLSKTEGYKKREKQRAGLTKVGLSMRKMRYMKKNGQKTFK
jgi:hypothetical protein